jgi:hypothetical protein
VAATKAYEQAVELWGVQGDAGKELRGYLLEQQRQGRPPAWRGYATALGRYLETANPDPAGAAGVCLELARVLGDELRQNDEALSVLSRGLAQSPHHADLRAEHAIRLEYAGQLPRALDELRRVLDDDVTQVKAWRDLVTLLGKMHRQADAAVALAALVALGAANDSERATAASLPVRSALMPAGSFGPVELLACDVLAPDDPVRAVVASVAEGLEKVHPPDLGRFGVGARDRIPPRSGHPLRSVAERVAAIFGVGDFQFYVQPSQQGALTVEFTDPVSIVVPAYLARLGEAQQVFLLGRVLGNVARLLHAVDRMTPQELELLVTGALHGVRPELGYGSGDTDGVFGGYAKRIYKSLSRRSRRTLEEVAERMKPGAKPDMVSWAQKAKTGAARSALMVADELPGCVTLVRQQEGDLAAISADAQARGVALAQDLVRFWVSDTAFSLRRRLGLM